VITIGHGGLVSAGVSYTPCMSDLKTKPTSQDPRAFLDTVEPDEKRRDSLTLLDLMQRITGAQAVMWGPSIVGFGSYHYKSERSRQEGDWPLVGFSPRKQNLTLYIMAGNQENRDALERLGKHKSSVGCVYIKRLADVNLDVLSTLIEASFTYMKRTNT
jgi:hypothetical protein